MRAPRRQHGEVLGAGKLRTARRRDLRQNLHRSRRRDRDDRRHRCQRRGRAHPCAPLGPHDAGVGGGRRGAARGGEQGAPPPPPPGGRGLHPPRRGRGQPGSPAPVRVVGMTGAVAVSGGYEHTCALLGDGTVRCWGRNAEGQLGDGTRTGSSTPVRVVGITGAVAVTGGWWHHTCALLRDGTAQCWGQNDFGQLGNGTTTSPSTPVTMTGTGATSTSSNSAVATIDATGLATGVSPGTTTITATDRSGASASTTLAVRDQVGRVSLSVIRAGAGTGSVSSSPSGISCGTDCSEPYARGTSVTLTASPARACTFNGWNGCDAVSGATCTVTMSASRSVTATFDLQRFILTVNRAGMGSGSVSSSPPGISCGTDCSEAYAADTVVTLTATPSPLSIFTDWSGCDTVSGATCTVTMSSARSISATFQGVPLQ